MIVFRIARKPAAKLDAAGPPLKAPAELKQKSLCYNLFRVTDSIRTPVRRGATT